MKVIICGAGRVGTGIAMQLASENNDITVIDTDREALSRISSAIDAQTVFGFACHPPVLEEAGAENADMLIAVTSSDEVNMIACQVAHSIFSTPTKIARIRHHNYLSPLYQDFYSDDEMPIDVIISPEIEVAKNILNRFHIPGAVDTFPIESSTLKIIAVRVPDSFKLTDKPLLETKNLLSSVNAAIIGVSRGEELWIPSDKEIIIPGDEIFLVTDNDHAQKTMVLLGHEEREARKVAIIGGGNIGLFIARGLEHDNREARIKVIEVNKARAEKIADELDRSVVINGSALDKEILEEANIGRAETVICVSNDDQVNILSALLAKTMGAQMVYALINNYSFMPLMPSLGIDVSVNPRETTVSSILRHVRRGRIRSAHTLKEGKAEVLEAEASETLGMVSKPISDIQLPEDVIIGAIIREGQFVKPLPDTILKKRDRIILLALSGSIKAVEDLFSLQTRFF